MISVTFLATETSDEEANQIYLDTYTTSSMEVGMLLGQCCIPMVPWLV